MDVSILNTGDEVGRKIGNPVSYNEAAAQAAAAKNNAAAANNNNNVKKENTNKPSPYTNNNNTNNANTSNLNATINSGLTHPISSLSPYQNKWVIKARVTAKSPIRTWSNAKGEGKLFSMDLMDESGEIRVTAFKEQCDKFYDMIEVDRVYFFSKCQLKPANKQYSTLKNDYEMTMTGETVIQLCEEDESGIPEVKYDFVPISQIANIEPKAAVGKFIYSICI